MCHSHRRYRAPKSNRLGFWDGVVMAAVPTLLLALVVMVYIPKDQQRVEALPMPPANGETYFQRSLEEMHEVVELCGGIEALWPIENLDTLQLLRHLHKALGNASLVYPDSSFEWSHRVMHRYFDILVPAAERMRLALETNERELLNDAFRRVCNWFRWYYDDYWLDNASFRWYVAP